MKLKLSHTQVRKLVKKRRLVFTFMSPVSLGLSLYYRLSPYFLSDLIGHRDSEIIKITERAN